MKVTTFTLKSLVNKVSKLFLKPNKQDAGTNKKGLIIKNVQNQPEEIED